MITLGILQNQWGTRAADPDYPERLLRLQALPADAYAQYVRWRLEESDCMTYRRLLKELGEEGFDAIAWTNASRKAGATASARFDACREHLGATLEHYCPDVIIAFGKVAAEGLTVVDLEDFGCAEAQIILAPHPVARHKGAGDELRAAVAKWRHACLEAV